MNPHTLLLAATAAAGLLCQAPAGAEQTPARATPAADAAPAALAPVLAFVSIRSGDPQIYTLDDSGQLTVRTQGKALPGQPTLSVDHRLAYTARSGGTPHVFVLPAPASGSDAAAAQNGGRLTQDEATETSPSWSPDGKALAYYAKPAGGGQIELRVRDVVSGHTDVLARSAHDMGPAAPSWSADGSRLAFATLNASDRSQIWVVQRDGSGAMNVSETVSVRGGAWPNLSPDGQQLLWVANQRGRAPVMLTDLRTGRSTDLTPEPLAAAESPRFSPDGRHITFASMRDSLEQGSNDIFVMDAAGGRMRNLSRHPAEDFDPKWSADGQRVVFASLRSGTSLLYEVSVDSGQTRALSVHASHDMDHVVRPPRR